VYDVAILQWRHAANSNTYRQAYYHAVDETAARRSAGALKFDSGGARTKSPTGLLVCLFVY